MSIIARAGSGKTQTLAHRVVHLIEQGAHPGHMLLLTFSRRAAQKMERRIERILISRGVSQGLAAIGLVRPSARGSCATSRIPLGTGLEGWAVARR